MVIPPAQFSTIFLRMKNGYAAMTPEKFHFSRDKGGMVDDSI